MSSVTSVGNVAGTAPNTNTAMPDIVDYGRKRKNSVSFDVPERKKSRHVESSRKRKLSESVKSIKRCKHGTSSGVHNQNERRALKDGSKTEHSDVTRWQNDRNVDSNNSDQSTTDVSIVNHFHAVSEESCIAGTRESVDISVRNIVENDPKNEVCRTIRKRQRGEREVCTDVAKTVKRQRGKNLCICSDGFKAKKGRPQKDVHARKCARCGLFFNEDNKGVTTNKTTGRKRGRPRLDVGEEVAIPLVFPEGDLRNDAENNATQQDNIHTEPNEKLKPKKGTHCQSRRTWSISKGPYCHVESSQRLVRL